MDGEDTLRDFRAGSDGMAVIWLDGCDVKGGEIGSVNRALFSEDKRNTLRWLWGRLNQSFIEAVFQPSVGGYVTGM